MRKPRGGPDDSIGELALRFGLCCGKPGCRRRVLPPSTRFLGRRVYFSIIVTLVSALRQAPTPTRMRKLTKELGVDRRTVERWQRWWRDEFPSSPGWRVGRGRFSATDDPAPRSMVMAFDAFDDVSAQVRLLCWFACLIAPEMITFDEGLLTGSSSTQKMTAAPV
jgi:hypothetical protein